MDINIDKSITNLIHQMESNYVQVYSNYKLCCFYEKNHEQSLESDNLNRIKKTIGALYNNKILECDCYVDSCGPCHKFKEQVLKPLQIKAIQDARKRIIQGRRNKYIKELLADDPIDE